MISVCFVCTGNICRSPTAQVVLEALVKQRGLAHAVTVDSSGTEGYHTGEQADSRTRAAAKRRGLAMTHRARQVADADFASFDYLIALDGGHLAILNRRAADLGKSKPKAQLHLLRSFDPDADSTDVADPYYGGPEGFEQVLDECQQACERLLDTLVERHCL